MTMLPTGLYQPGDSVLHRLCPWVKLTCFLLLLVGAICTQTLWGYGLAATTAIVLMALSRLHIRSLLSAVWRLKWFFLTIFFMNLCFFSAQTPWFSWWVFTPSAVGAMQGVHVVSRVVLALVFSSILTATTAPMAMTDAFRTLLAPLGLVKIPVGQIAMILSVAMQFIPTLFEQADAICKAQTARGAGFDSRRLRDKAAAVLPLAVPIFLAAFQHADELSLAMEARGYRNGQSFGPKRYPFAIIDLMALLLCLCLGAAGILL